MALVKSTRQGDVRRWVYCLCVERLEKYVHTQTWSRPSSYYMTYSDGVSYNSNWPEQHTRIYICTYKVVVVVPLFFKRYTIFSLFRFPGSFPTSFINSNGRWRWWSTEIHTHNRIEGSKYKTVSSKSTSSSSPCFLMRTHLLTFFFFRRRREELLPGTTEKEEKEIYIRPKQNIQKKKKNIIII